MKICHIAATTEGATWMCEQLMELRDRYGHEVCAIVETGSGELLRKLERERIAYRQFDFSFPVFSDAYTLLLRVIALADVLRRERFDVVQTHLFNSMVLGRLAAWLADVPVRLAMIAGPYHLEAHTPRWIDASTMWMETALIPSCEYTRELYRELGVRDDRLFVVYYGPDERKFDPDATAPADIRSEMGWKEDVPLIAMVAYFYPALPASTWTPPRLHNVANKRHEDLIDAAPEILREFPEARILMIGSSWGEAGAAVEAGLRKRVADAGLQDHVHFLGFRRDVNSLLKEADVAVQASVTENLGGTLESLLMACPTVATRSGGMVDSVRDGVTGVLVEPLNPSALAEGVLRLLRDRPQARRFGEAGRALAIERFALRRTVDDLDHVYRKLSARRSRPYRMWVSAWRTVAAMPVFLYLAVRLTRDMAQLLPGEALLRRSLAWVRALPSNVSGQAGRVRLRMESLTAPPAPMPAMRRLAGTWDRNVPLESPKRPFAPMRPIRRLAGGLVRNLRRLLGWIRVRPLYIYGWLRRLLRGTALLRGWDILFAHIRGRDPV